MKYGFVLPFGDAKVAAESATLAEKFGWDGFFVWEPVWGMDAWVSLAAAAMVTEKIRLGTMLTPIARMRPWKLASETVALDHLSNGRLILSIGLGATDIYKGFPEATDRKLRAELTDEGLDILTGLWSGAPFRYEGKHYQLDVPEKPIGPAHPPAPVQTPRIPIWMVGAWNKEKSMQRALRYDGLLPAMMDASGKVSMEPALPQDISEIAQYIMEHRTAPGSYEIVVEGNTPGENQEQAARNVREYSDAGATWWIEALWSAEDKEQFTRRIVQGPPCVNE